MTGINDRLRQIRGHFNLSMREFSKKIGYSHSLYGAIECGKRDPTDRIIDLIVSKFNINRNWIFKGEGEMINSNQSDLRLNRILEIYNTIDDSLKNALVAQSEILLKLYRKDK